MSCPVCALPLADTDPGQRGCAKCRGAWITNEAFEKFVHTAGYDPKRDLVMAAVTSRDSRACPECAQPMQPGTVLDVLVDHCPAHGLWTDAGELSRIVLAIRRR